MKDGSYVSEALVAKSYMRNTINLITAGCGTGKTTAAFKTIPEFLHVAPARCLILIDTTAGEEQFVKQGYANFYAEGQNWDGWDTEHIPDLPNLPTVMTYQKLGALLKKQQINPADYDYIVADEFHSITMPISIDRNRLKKIYPQCDIWEINDMLRMTSFSYIATEAIRDWAEDDHTWVFALSTTPQPLERINFIYSVINEVKMSSALRAFETISKMNYTEIDDILKMRIADSEKRVFYFNTVKELQKYKAVLQSYGRQAEAIWSVNNSKVPMSSQQRTTRDYVLDNHQLPSEVQDLLINAAYLTAIDIKDPSIKQLYIHDGNAIKREQVRGRLRQDLDMVGYYDSTQAVAEKKADKRNADNRIGAQELLKREVVVPEKYVGVELLTEDKDRLIEEINYPKKWTTLKKALTSQGYIIKDNRKTINGKKVSFSVISNENH